MVDLVFPIMLLVVGLMFAVMSFGSRTHEQERRSRGVVLEGLIVGSEWHRVGTGPAFQAPVVEYVDQAGETRRFLHRSGTSFAPAIGAHVGVWLDPATGEGPLLHEDRVGSWLTRFFGIAGVGAVGLALFLLWSVLT